MHWEAPHLKEAGLDARAPPPALAHSLRPRLSSQQPEGRVTTPGPGSASWAPRPRSLRAALGGQARVQLGCGPVRGPAPRHLPSGTPFPFLPGLFLLAPLVSATFPPGSLPWGPGLHVKTNTRTPGWQGDGGTRGKCSLRSPHARRAPDASGAARPELPGPGPPVPARLHPGRAARRAQGPAGRGRPGLSPVRVLRVRPSNQREVDNSCSGSPGSLSSHAGPERLKSVVYFYPYPG
ncbi:MAPK-interacting and spindle-stabilizing protein-like [Cervus elaphus]|uniref:MAPK-interacting and spindle-stabilizing protein-like n=1 Tax=Cervus canadensis TaxID=1574408 RepID=UPI001CA383E6|nr:MAPK-interacting and spindle-stabilizing protein-like [Cervus canadensis]XP_043744205.1 MAPK-interacting and spindle-stabilizing protein-like [Cervus elaphus]